MKEKMKDIDILSLYQKKIVRKVILFCVVILMINGIVINGIVINGIVTKGLATETNRSVIIGFKHTVSSADDLVISGHGGKAKKDFHLIPAIAASVPESKIAEMRNDSNVAYVVNDSIFKATDEYSNSWGVQYIGSQPVHNHSVYGTGVKIAVLDTGIDYNHPDLKDNYKGGFNFIGNNSDPWDDNCLDQYNTCHGTHVSGTIAAELNGFGVVGVAPEASIYAVKVLNGGGLGAASYVLSGIEWAVNNNMTIISMSIESAENNTAVFDALNAAYNSGILLVAAGGNPNPAGGPVSYPAAYDSVIAVTAIDQNDQNATFAPIDAKIELAAPGVNINSTKCLSGGLPNICLTEGYGILSGTSMAAPHVTGVAALIFSTHFPDVNRDGKRNNVDVRLILQKTARHVGTPGRNNIYGFGVVDAQNAILGIPTTPTTSKLTLIRTKGGPDSDSKTISLSQGSYSIIINNTNLSELAMMVYDDGKIRKDLSKTFIFNSWSDPNLPSSSNWADPNVVLSSLSGINVGLDKPKPNPNHQNNIGVNLDVQKLLKVVFVPYGIKGTTCNVTVKKVA